MIDTEERRTDWRKKSKLLPFATRQFGGDEEQQVERERRRIAKEEERQ